MRKLLMIEQSDSSFVLMLEIADRSHSYNVPRALGVRLLDGIMDSVFATLANHTGVTIEMIGRGPVMGRKGERDRR